MEQFKCVKKCYFHESRWRPDQVFTFRPGMLDPNGKPARTPDQAGVGRCFERITADQAVALLQQANQDEKAKREKVKKNPMPDFKERFDSHD